MTIICFVMEGRLWLNVVWLIKLCVENKRRMRYFVLIYVKRCCISSPTDYLPGVVREASCCWAEDQPCSSQRCSILRGGKDSCHLIMFPDWYWDVVYHLSQIICQVSSEKPVVVELRTNRAPVSDVAFSEAAKTAVICYENMSVALWYNPKVDDSGDQSG